MPGVVVRPMAQVEVPLMVDYFLTASPDLHERMGVDPARLPERGWWIDHVVEDLDRPMAERQLLYMVAEVDGEALGHCNVNKIQFGVEAYMHLHLWQAGTRMRGVGTEMARQSLPQFCQSLELAVIYCEPKADNDAPNRTLPKVGFEFIRKYQTTPGWLNFEQDVNRWAYRCGG